MWLRPAARDALFESKEVRSDLLTFCRGKSDTRGAERPLARIFRRLHVLFLSTLHQRCEMHRYFRREMRDVC
jgi:hypothetical protein